MSIFDSLLSSGLLPDPLVRSGIRHRLSARLSSESQGDVEDRDRRFSEFLTGLDGSPIALNTVEANTLIYQVPTEFYLQVLGPRLKGSSGYWSSKKTTLAEAEEEMLLLVCERAELQDGQKILELGCGWGAMTLWMAEQFPNSSITAVSNSYTQRLHIEAEANRREFYNVRVITADINTFSAPEPGSYDRVVSVELFPQLKNYREVMRRISVWLKPESKLFVQTTTHREYSYHFDNANSLDWIGRNFLPGGTMPSHDLLLHFQHDLRIVHRWRINGMHAARTAEAWLHALRMNRKAILPVLEKVHGRVDTRQRYAYWDVFFMACAELWSYREGEEWMISHYLFEK